MRVMMSAAGSAVAPSIIRHLQSLGHYVMGHDSNGFAEFTSPAVDHQNYFRFVEGMWHDVYIPFLDEELRRFAFIPRIEKALYSPNETLRVFTSKIVQQGAMELRELPVAPLPIHCKGVAKPNFGRGGKGVIITDDQGVLDACLGAGYSLQKFIDGDEYTVDALTGLDGSFLFAVPRLRIQANGVSVIGKIAMDEEIIDLARQVVSKFKFAGPINIQVIRERDTGKLYIIEVNPRLSGSCMFTVMAGFDILDATIKLWERKPFVPPSKIENGLIIRRHYVEERL